MKHSRSTPPLLASGKVRRLLGSLAGLALIGAAVFAVVSSRGAIAQAQGTLSRASLWLVFAALVLPLANWSLISVSFWLLNRRYGIVRLGEMHALIGSAWLLNYLPLRPGMFGRVAYHQRVNGIRVRDSARVMVINVSLTAASCALLCAMAYLTMDLHPVAAWLFITVPGLMMLGLGGAMAVALGSPFRLPASVILVSSVRYFDILAWVGRYAVAFALIGHPLGLPHATLLTAASQLALMVPLVGNGLGLREWAIGLTFPLLAADAARTVGLSADLLNRAAELVIALPVGLISAGWLVRTSRREGMKSG